MRTSHRTQAEEVLARAVEEEVRRSGGRTDGQVLLSRARGELDALLRTADEEYAAYEAAIAAAEAERQSFGQRYAREGAGTPLLVAGVAAAAACAADLAFGTGASTALGAGAVVGVAGAAATVVKVGAVHWPAAHRQAGALGQPGGPEQLRLAWLTALEVRGVRPFLERQRTPAVPAARRAAPARRHAGPVLGRTDKSALARRRSVLQRSFERLPSEEGPFAGRRELMARITQEVRAARAATETRPVVLVLHGEPGAGRTTLAVRAARELKDQFRGACVVDLRGGGQSRTVPLSTREALLHLLNRLGAPREQLLQREGSAPEQQTRRLAELYQRHLTDIPVIVVLDDASDPGQVAALVPEHSDSLVLVTAREPMELPEGTAARVRQLPVTALDAAGAEEVLRAAAGEAPDPYDAQATDRIVELCGGLPLALRVAGSALAGRTPRELASALEAYGPVSPVERALWLRHTDQEVAARRLLRRLALAGRASLGAAAAAALLDTGEQEAERLLGVLAAAGLIDRVRGSRYRLHTLVRGFARARLTDEEPAAERTAAQERLIVNYAELAEQVIGLVDGRSSTRADSAFQAGAMGPHGFSSLEYALNWLDQESSFITAALRDAEGVDQGAVRNLLGALCDYCLLRGDLYRLGELNDLARAVDQGLLARSVQWRTGIAERQLGELDKARTTLTSVVGLYYEAHHETGAALALCSLGITLHHQGKLAEAAEKLREALALQQPGELAADRAWTLHALGAVERDRSRLTEAERLLAQADRLHTANSSLHGQAWTRFQLGQVRLRQGTVERAEEELRAALELYGRTGDVRGQAWALTQLGRARLHRDQGTEGPEAAEELRGALSRHRDNEDARGEAWTRYYLGQALEDSGDLATAVRELERARTMFSRMRDVYGLACARHHSARVTRDLRAAQTGSLRNSGFARQLLVDARADFRRIGVAHGEAWTCLELAVTDAGNGRTGQALTLAEEATALFTSYGDTRGEEWSRFLTATLLPFAAPAGPESGTAQALALLDDLMASPSPARDARLTTCLPAFRLLVERGVDPAGEWPVWALGLVPGRHAREVMGVR
ncbi:AAA family ATPase [Streptomyces sp. CAI-21]|uniref:NB-ARC domain-containing protein n=1 Tax=Streptomyces sp. CAI-21 TaxID=1169743 RepID=UPI00158727E4|nr:AAA family ATPase [Streptomyces sp. CAI-21]